MRAFFRTWASPLEGDVPGAPLSDEASLRCSHAVRARGRAGLPGPGQEARRAEADPRRGAGDPRRRGPVGRLGTEAGPFRSEQPGYDGGQSSMSSEAGLATAIASSSVVIA